MLSNELEIVQILDKEEREEAVSVSQFIVVDGQFDEEVEEIDKNSDVNEEYLQKYLVNQIGVLFPKKRALQDFMGFWGIAKNQLSHLVTLFNFQGGQDAQTTIIVILLYLFYFQALWQLWADTGGFHNKIPKFLKKSGI